MKQTQGYVILYACILTIVCGVLLALASVSLKPLQDVNIAKEKKQSILSVAMDLKDGDNIDSLYLDFVTQYKVVGAKATKVADPDSANLFEVKGPDKKVIGYVIPMEGNGLWDKIWGYVALKDDANTISGVILDHKGETPGLGARITSDEIQNRYKGKKIYEGDEIVGIQMIKGEQGGGEKSIKAMESKPHEIDGMTGATITGNGVNDMFKVSLADYKPYLDSKRK